MGRKKNVEQVIEQATEKEQAYLVLCEPRIVLFGYATPTEIAKPNPTLKRARMLIYWSAETKGVLGAASIGPQRGSRISPPVPEQTIRTKVEAHILCSEESVKRFEEGGWSS